MKVYIFFLVLVSVCMTGEEMLYLSKGDTRDGFVMFSLLYTNTVTELKC